MHNSISNYLPIRRVTEIEKFPRPNCGPVTYFASLSSHMSVSPGSLGRVAAGLLLLPPPWSLCSYQRFTTNCVLDPYKIPARA